MNTSVLKKALAASAVAAVSLSAGAVLSSDIKLSKAINWVPPAGSSELIGKIQVDGSSTVYPITAAMAEGFNEHCPQVNITVGISGTGGGFKRFVKGETDISNASRPVKNKEIGKLIQANENKDPQDLVSFVEVPVAYDGLTIVVNKFNKAVDQLTVDQLRRIFLVKDPNGNDATPVNNWNELDPNWPDMPITLYAPGTDSGTFDYFKEVVAKKKGVIRPDMSVSEDDNVLVRGVEGNRGALGFFGCAYFFANQDKLRAVPIVNKNGNPVPPTTQTIENGDYNPFSRPLFIYLNANSLRNKPQVKTFVDFYLDNAGEVAEAVGYVRLPESVQDRARHNVDNLHTGTQFVTPAGEKVGGSVEQVYRKLGETDPIRRGR